MVKGGKREGAGRPKHTGKYKSPTIRMRVPENKLEAIEAIIESRYEIPLFSSRVSAGFPTAVEDYLEGKLDLNQHLIQRPTSTFFVRVSGDSMIGAGIHPDDILIVDKSLTAKNNDIIIAVVNSELTVKRLHKTPTTLSLLPENPLYSPIEITQDTQFSIWGIVTSVIHQFR